MANQERYEQGLQIRREVLGDDYVDRALANVDDFNRPLQEFLNDYCWGGLWSRPGLPRKTRSLIVIAILSLLGKERELKAHTKGAIRNGCTIEEIQEALLHVAVYGGIPNGVDAFRIAKEALAEG
jgi:4-carboxymuconolactone decarboxylase